MNQSNDRNDTNPVQGSITKRQAKVALAIVCGMFISLTAGLPTMQPRNAGCPPVARFVQTAQWDFTYVLKEQPVGDGLIRVEYELRLFGATPSQMAPYTIFTRAQPGVPDYMTLIPIHDDGPGSPDGEYMWKGSIYTPRGSVYRIESAVTNRTNVDDRKIRSGTFIAGATFVPHSPQLLHPPAAPTKSIAHSKDVADFIAAQKTTEGRAAVKRRYEHLGRPELYEAYYASIDQARSTTVEYSSLAKPGR